MNSTYYAHPFACRKSIISLILYFIISPPVILAATCESGLNTCSKPHLPSGCVAQWPALRAAMPVTGV